ncbi:MAG: phosphate ABC transporter substrate-binding protein PstS family protein [Atopobiaceae bacterium]|jgi:phosphate transport system substrate-binding protein|nr:phosphate ABC transporter substrate-binding protein PstS family protein [Atopobiaceae bacterium]MCH4181024.1 phosphate ABC transporter substrate-binding protein PstS family protein [Atopobiaceae bacterium]MCH4229736.1 phosphate ABC transporter substrate-binding protein PstS family protein [Atopobiaceae bacterium]MCH4276067.1 phosphate ABC transporter substrate-binding protein PstS family protein [Atopobiaceae bacterium]MCI1260136.1 phosphate ABC transporter substrate-binding protein PstS fam
MHNDMSRRQFLGLAGGLAAVCGLGLVGCGGSGSSSAATTAAASTSAALSGSVTAVGSTALQPLVEAAAEQFMADNSGVQITVQGGGSGQGITQISQGAVQIGDSDVFAEEKLQDKSDASKLTDNKVAVVGMGPVVNKDVTVDDIALEDLKGIFCGTITNWNQVGGADEAITVINRASGSGTRATFESNVLKGTTVPDTFKPQEQDSSGTVAKMVAETPGAISYLAFSYYADTFKALKVGGVEAKAASVEDNTWTIWAYEHMYTAASPDAATQGFIDYMMGDEVQGSLVEQNGYIPVSGMKVSRDADGNVTTN